ncbi:putative RNA polymerase II subunit B1 CTD phosphatase RPAP2 homolog [Aristolochia californica]|uniref:putative RNA polymerase II subunit B1 CTD phosphatase RPAP2 homolog n=1 Tax=Aristolochia californica TaxID=171875 RepID=UPI0035E19B70
MEKDPVRSVKEAVYKIQLSLLDGIHHEKQLFTAGKLLSRADYEDVVTERAIGNICGYPLCQNLLPSDQLHKGRYRIALKEHKVYDLHETRKFCSTECVINSRAFSANLKSEQHSVYDFTNVEEVLRLFGNFRLSNKENIVGKKEESGLPEITIVENKGAKDGEISLEEWIGPANAIEGYVPLRERCISPSREKGTKLETGLKMENETFGDYLNFTSEIIMDNQQTIPKKPLIHKKNIETGGSAVTVGHQNSISRKSSSSKKKNSESKVKKPAKDVYVREKAELTTASLDVSSAVEAKTLDGSIEKVVEENERQHDSSTDAVAEERTNMWQVEYSMKLSGTKTSIEATETLAHSDNDQLVLTSNYLGSNKLKDPSASEANGNHLKSSLKSSRGTLNRNVTWADEKKPGDTSDGKLCKFQEIESHCERKKSLEASVGEDESISFRLASAEACAQALTQAAEAVASGEFDSGDAVSGAGICISPLDSEGHEDVSEPFQGGAKWPTKPVLLDTDAFGCDDSWHDSPPEGFRLTLSPFSTMWMTLFGWISSSSLTYIYGRDGSAEDAFSCVNGREYPHRTVLSDGRSLEIKQTLAVCIAQALPELTTVLRISTPISTLEKAMVALLDTMSFLDALPPFKRKQWHVIVLLFLEALSVNRIPSLTQQMANMRVVKHKVLNGAQVSSEEYEIMKDLLIPLGRAPEFSVQSGG